jgi:hypothetical protein
VVSKKVCIYEKSEKRKMEGERISTRKARKMYKKKKVEKDIL